MRRIGGILAGLWVFWATGVWAQTPERGVIESPSAFVSGIGFISGWKCNTNDIELWLTGSAREGVLKLNPAQNMPRSDTAGVCLGEENNGWIIQVNWNELIGYDTVVARDNGEAFDSRRFTIGHTGLPFIQDKAGTEVEVVDFPSPGKATTLTWSTATQHFEVSGTEDINTCAGDACPPGSGEGGGEGSSTGGEERPDPIGYYKGIAVYSEPPSFSCDEVWVRDSVSPYGSVWYCRSEASRIAFSCPEGINYGSHPVAQVRPHAWCIVSKTCTNENFEGEYTNLDARSDTAYSCYRVKTGCVNFSRHFPGIPNVPMNDFYYTRACFTNVSWTNTFHDIENTCRYPHHACYDADGDEVYGTHPSRSHGSLDNAVSCTWYCD